MAEKQVEGKLGSAKVDDGESEWWRKWVTEKVREALVHRSRR